MYVSGSPLDAAVSPEIDTSSNDPTYALLRARLAQLELPDAAAVRRREVDTVLWATQLLPQLQAEELPELLAGLVVALAFDERGHGHGDRWKLWVV